MAVLGPESRCARTREVRRLAGEPSAGCLGFEGSRPRRPFRLSVRTTAEKWAVVRKGGRDPGKGLSAQAVHNNAGKHPESKNLEPRRPRGPYRDHPAPHEQGRWIRGGAETRSKHVLP